MTPWKKHVADWKDCIRCPLCNQRDKICLGKGVVPCQVCFIGEAPGDSENDLGYPFAGPAGHILHEWVERGQSLYERLFGTRLRCSYTNLVACYPAEAKQTENHQPSPEEIKACSERLAEYIKLCGPSLKLVVCVGALSGKWVEKMKGQLGLEGVQIVKILHPARLFHLKDVQKDSEAQLARVTLSTAFQTLGETLYGTQG